MPHRFRTGVRWNKNSSGWNKNLAMPCASPNSRSSLTSCFAGLSTPGFQKEARLRFSAEKALTKLGRRTALTRLNDYREMIDLPRGHRELKVPKRCRLKAQFMARKSTRKFTGLYTRKAQVRFQKSTAHRRKSAALCVPYLCFSSVKTLVFDL